MTKRVSILALATLLPVAVLILVIRVSAMGVDGHEPQQKYDVALQQRLEERPDDRLSFIVHLREQADLEHNLPSQRSERRHTIASRLQRTAASSQQHLLSTLEDLRASGKVAGFQPLWIVNAVIVDGLASVPTLLAQRTDVAHITLNARQQYIQPPELQPQEATRQMWNLQQIHAPRTWYGLGITGTGVTIAIMDTGVDWTHPVLRGNYRGSQINGSVHHEGNWYDVVDPSAAMAEPIDPNGHGTHVAGTAVGGDGIGVAPGANWIAVRVFDNSGFATIGRIHLAFQWLLAPAQDPELAPDVVNGSWSGNGQITAFTEDIDALRQAGIVTVFAAGNDGPYTGTIGAPASYSHTIAVAAVDDRQKVTWFSSRGPSPLTVARKPDLAAPGAPIYSSLPGGAYGSSIGTSMAAPHVSGAAALLLSADPALNPADVTRVLTSTARDIAPAGHDMAAGWGHVDVYAAVAQRMTVGRVQGTVSAGGIPLPRSRVTITTPAGAILPLITDGSGAFGAWLRPGNHTIQGNAFGHIASAPAVIEVTANHITRRDLHLQSRPHGQVTGRITQANGQQAVADATIQVAQTPVSTTTDARGQYTLTLPADQQYLVQARRTGFRLTSFTVTLHADGRIGRDIQLIPTQSILLVDSGRWYYASQVAYVSQALETSGYAYDIWPIYAPGETPPAGMLQEYDVVMWSAPQDAPAWIGGGDALVSYLEAGGNLLVSGQNVARRDGASPTAHSWFTQFLQGEYLGAATAPFTITGAGGTPFIGMHFPLNGAGSAANQIAPARAVPQKDSLTRTTLTYDDEDEAIGAALQAGWCEPYNIQFFGFGLEGVAPAARRTDLVQRALDHFSGPPVSRAIALEPTQRNEVVLPGQYLTATFSVRNLSEVQTTTIQLNYESEWPSRISDASVILGPCQSQLITMTLQVPQELPQEAMQTIELMARADYGAVAGASIVTSAPEPLLLVADYRFYNEATEYRSALLDLGLSYDVWDTNERGSPGPERLNAYPTVLWFTGYDWYEPLTTNELLSLATYLRQGGRLFLSSQDYMYYHRYDSFTREFLGIQDFQETVTSTSLLGGDNAVIGNDMGPYKLDFDRYRNFSDGLVASPGSKVHIWNDWGFAVGVATHGDPWRSIFWSAPLELLPEHAHPILINQILGWLGDLGDSTLEVAPRNGPLTATRFVTLTLQNWEYAPRNQALVTITVDSDLAIDLASLNGGIDVDPDTGRLSWHGRLDPGAAHEITFQAQPSASAPLMDGLGVTATVAYASYRTRWKLTEMSWSGGPELAGSTLSVFPQEAGNDRPVNYTAVLRNSAARASGPVSATLSFPRDIHPVSGTLRATEGQVSGSGPHFFWHGALEGYGVVSFSVTVTTTGYLQERLLPAGLVITDGVSAPVIRPSNVRVVPFRRLFPFVQWR